MSYMLSFTAGTPIAAICGGPYDGKTLHITEEKEQPDRNLQDEDVMDLLDEDDMVIPTSRMKMLPIMERIKLGKAIARRQQPLDEHLVAMYIKNRALVDHKLKKELNIECGTMFILPSQQTERVYIAGKSGSGKSCLASMYMNEYRRLYPTNKIWLISRHNGEAAYEKIQHEVIPLTLFEKQPRLAGEEDEEGEEGLPVDLTDLSNSLVVFDDCDNLQEKYVNDGLRKLSNDIISNGRKYGIYTIWLNHQLMEYTKTRNLLNEANKVIFFNSGNNYHIQRYLKTYVGMNADTIKKILALKSRWTMVALTLPSYVLHEHGCFLI
jgi:hypothetical protein